MIGDPVDPFLCRRFSFCIIGKHLFCNFQFHEILQINADLGP